MKSKLRCILMFTAILSPLSLGCKDSQVTEQVSDSLDTANPFAAGDGAGVDAASLERRPVVPGTIVSRSVDDPALDGWETEAAAADFGEQLKHLMLALDGDQGESHVSLVCTDDATCKALGSESPAIAYQHGGVVVRRVGELGDDREEISISDGMNRLLANVDSVSNTRSKVKVFRVHLPKVDGRLGGESATCSAYLQVSGKSSQGHFQVNTTIDCDWQLQASAAPRLKRFVVREWEQVVAGNEVADAVASGETSEVAGARMFADCTAAVMNGDEAFQKQLLPGVDHWLGSIESRLGIDIGGWQGISVADVNGDGLDDLYCAQPGGLPNRLYIQQPDGTCAEKSKAAGLDWLDSSHASLFVDLDNDGDQDAVVGLKDGLLILANDGQGVFEVRAEKILPAALPYSISAADFDGDSDLDLYVCCYNRRSGVNQHLLFARPVPYHDANNGGRNVLLVNEVDPSKPEWTFRYRTKQLGLDENNRRFSYASAWEDYDNDGDLDLYVANDFGRNNLYQNDAGKFRDVASNAAVEDIAPGMSACWGDYNNDGFVDLYVSNMFSSAGNRITFQDRFMKSVGGETRADFQRHARGNSLFQNEGDGTFRDVSEDANVTLGRWAWGSRFADLNNDGWQDLIVANGFITQQDTGDL